LLLAQFIQSKEFVLTDDFEEVITMTGSRMDNRSSRYQIRLKGVLDAKWADWFDGFSIVPESEENTLLDGEVPDQATLHGILMKIGDLGLTLLSLERLGSNLDENNRL
jgi:hypothetical protein